MSENLVVNCCPTLTYNCDICDIPFKSGDSLMEHLKREGHLYIYHCCCCNYLTNRYHNLFQHNRDKHCKTYNLTHCIKCHYVCNTMNELNQHYWNTHMALENGYYCTLCNYSTISADNIEKHVNNVHNGLYSLCNCSTELRTTDLTSSSIKFKCSFCKCERDTLNRLLKHFKNTHWLLYNREDVILRTTYDDDTDDEDIIINGNFKCIFCFDVVEDSIDEMVRHIDYHQVSVGCRFCKYMNDNAHPLPAPPPTPT